jgi:hypothetical protein
MKKYVSLVAGMVLLALVPGVSGAQTCSCAGVPILGAMESASPKDSQWYLAGTYEYHDISELVSGSSTVHDGTGRDRTAQAMILEASRGLSEKWSFSALLSAIEHERDVGGQRDTVNGVGDAIVMLKYSPKTISLYEKTTVSFGLGTRLAIGEDDAKSQGVVLAEDLQPSTGAYGGILWVYAARALNDSRGARIYASALRRASSAATRHKHRGASISNFCIGMPIAISAPPLTSPIRAEHGWTSFRRCNTTLMNHWLCEPRRKFPCLATSMTSCSLRANTRSGCHCPTYSAATTSPPRGAGLSR